MVKQRPLIQYLEARSRYLTTMVLVELSSISRLYRTITGTHAEQVFTHYTVQLCTALQSPKLVSRVHTCYRHVSAFSVQTNMQSEVVDTTAFESWPLLRPDELGTLPADVLRASVADLELMCGQVIGGSGDIEREKYAQLQECRVQLCLFRNSVLACFKHFERFTSSCPLFPTVHLQKMPLRSMRRGNGSAPYLFCRRGQLKTECKRYWQVCPSPTTRTNGLCCYQGS